jgi:hypothetical protein
MLFILGLLGIIQAVYLPGIIVYNALKVKSTLPVYISSIFALSLAINSNLVFILCLIGQYNQNVMLIIFVIEIAIFVIQRKIFRDKTINISDINKFKIYNDINNINIIFGKNTKLILDIGKIILVLFLLSVMFNTTGFAGLGEIFVFEDSVKSWNRWAVELATLGYPELPFRYPQLLPAVLSLPYVFMDNTWIQFFSYAICLFFPSCFILACISIYDKFPFSSFLVVVILLLWPFKKFVHYIGYADIPVSFLGFLAVIAIIWGYKESEQVKLKCLILSAIFLGAAGAVKQAGLMLIICFPFVLLEFKAIRIYGKKLQLIILFVIIVVLFASPWNFYCEYLIRANKNFSNVNFLVEGIHANRSFIERIFHSASMYPGIYLLTLLSIPGLFIDKNRSISIFSIIYSIVWMFLFSYDARNYYIAIPFTAFSIGLTIQKILLRLFERKKLNTFNFKSIIKSYNIYIKYSVIVLICLVAIFSIIKSEKINLILYNRQDRKLLSLNYNRSDNIFIANLSKNDPNCIFITDDPIIGYLTPELKTRVISIYLNNDVNHDVLALKTITDKNSVKNIYLYLSSRAETSINDVLNNNLDLIFNGFGQVYKYKH